MRAVVVAAGMVAVLVLGLLQGCAESVTPAVYGEFSVTRSGGVAGLHDRLRVAPDGLAVELAPELRAGRLSAERTAATRRVLESEELAREARAARRDEGDDCLDTIVTAVSMGSFSMADPGTCSSDRSRDTPAFDELLTLVGDARRGRFDQPLATGDGVVATVHVAEPGTAGRGASTIDVDPDGAATLRREGAEPERATLSEDQRDAVAVVAAGLLEVAPTSCTLESSPTVEVVAADGRRVSGSACGFSARRFDAYALLEELERVVGLR